MKCVYIAGQAVEAEVLGVQGQYFDYLHHIDACAADRLFAVLK